MAEQSQTIVSASEIEISFGQQNILDKASLSIREGDRIGMVGRNGTGKSTFLKILAGIAQPDAGQVAFRVAHSARAVKDFCAAALRLRWSKLKLPWNGWRSLLSA